MRTEPPNGDELARLLASMKERVLEQTAEDPVTRTRDTRLRNRIIGALASVALLLGVGAGAAFALGLWSGEPATTNSAPPSTSTPRPSPAPSPSASPAEQYVVEPAPEPVPAVIEITSERLAVIADNGAELASFDYFAPAEPLIATLTDYLGDPVVSELESRGDGFTGTRYEWAGFAIGDHRFPGAAPDRPDYYVDVRTATVSGLVVRTAPGIGSENGVSVGDPVDVVIADDPWSEFTDSRTGRTTRSTRIGVGDALPPLEGMPGGPYNFGISIGAYADTGLIDALGAPSPNWGP